MDGTLRHVTLRVEHSCPLARLSRQFPTAELNAWSGHRLEVVEVHAGPGLWKNVAAAAGELLNPIRSLTVRGGGVFVWEPKVAATHSLSHILESHGMVWLQPLRLRAGWEHYDAITVGGEDERAALRELAREGTTQVARRRNVSPEDVLASLFLSLHPVLAAPTDKQTQALVAAWREGYYESPRKRTTAEVAATLGIGRSAFEERLRAGENRVLAALGPALERQTQPDGRP
jgi:predicted DNA binding protein